MKLSPAKITLIALMVLVKYLSLFLWQKNQLDFSHFAYFINPITGFIIFFCLPTDNKNKNPFNLSICIVDIFMPGFGVVSLSIFGFIMFLVRKVYKKMGSEVYELPQTDEEFEHYLLEKKIRLSEETAETQTRDLLDSLTIEPYVDIFESDNKELKLNAIDKLSKLKDASSVGLLKMALEDEEYEVKYFANNALGKIEESLLAEVDSISENIKNNPSEYTFYNARGALYLNIYRIDILDRVTSEFFLEKALYDFIFSLQLNGSQPDVYVRITSIYILKKEFSRVVDIATDALEQELSEADREKILFYRAEAYFNLRQFKNLKGDCTQIADMHSDFDLIQKTSEWWRDIESL
jgi:hypothetical protein